MAVLAKTAVGKAQIATRKSGHFAPGPPAANLQPPPPPAGPVPAPFLYIAKTSSAHSGTLAETQCKGAQCLTVASAMDVERPGNIPTKPVEGPGADVVTHVTIGQARMMTGSARTDMANEKVCRTGDQVSLNVPMPESKLHQSQGVLILGFMPGMSDAQKKRVLAKAMKNAALVTKTGDPVAVVSGEVMDDVLDLSLPGLIPVHFTRHYASGRNLDATPLGRGGWTHAFDQWIEPAAGGIDLSEGDGRVISLAAIEPRAQVFDRAARIFVTRSSKKSYEVRSLATGRTREFAPLGSGDRAVLRAIRDAWGNRVELVYDRDRLVTIVDTAKRELRLTYDRKGRVVRVDAWALGEVRQSVVYGYGDGGELALVENALGESDRYAYDGQHRLVGKQLRGGLRVRFQYGDDGRCVLSTAEGRVQRVALEYDDVARTTTVHGNPQPVIYTWDDRGIVVRAETPDGSIATEYTYDDDLYLVATKNVAGHATEHAYDALGNRVRAVNAAGQETTWEYDPEGRVTKRTAPGGLVTSCAYDARGAMVSITNPSGSTFYRTPDEHGRLVAVDGPTGRMLTLTHDPQHNVVREVDARGAATTKEYDVLGRLVRRVDAIGRVMEVTYDAIGRPVLHKVGDGTEITLEWNAGDNVVRNHDAFGHTVTAEHTGTGVIAKRTMPDGQAWEFRYDILERLRTIKNPRGETYDFAYDRAGRVIEHKTFDGRLLGFQYSKAGEIARVEYPDDTWITMARDPLHRIVEMSSIHGNRRFAWSESGLLLEAVVEEHDGTTEVTNEYGEDGRLLVSRQGDHEVRYEYDEQGRVAARILPGEHTTRYFWDAANQLVGVDHQGHKLLLQHDVLGRTVRQYAYRGGVDNVISYDPTDRFAEQLVTARPSGTAAVLPISRRSWSYGPHARVRAMADARWGTTTYEHDEAGRLLAARRGSHEELYSYDGAGYLVGMRAREADPEDAWAIATGNVLRRAGETEIAYDERHRRVRESRRGQVTEYLWDVFDQLREVRLPDGRRVLFRYDALGRRVQKDVIAAPPALDALPTEAPAIRTVQYIWDRDEIAAEIDSEQGMRVYVSDPQSFVPLLQEEGGKVFTCIAGHLGVPRELVDAEGRVAWAGIQTAWGAITAEQRDPAYRGGDVASPFRLLGQYRDPETGLAYTRFRYFDPATARWLSPDPLHIRGGSDLFGWNGSPTERVDPLGLKNKDQFEAFLKKTDAARERAHAEAQAEQRRLVQEIENDQALPDTRKPFVESQTTSAAKVGFNEDGTPILPAPPPGRNIPGGGPECHAERVIGPLEGTAVGAGRPHCVNCLNAIQAGGGVPASPIRSVGDDAYTPPPVPDAAGQSAAQQQWNGPPV